MLFQKVLIVIFVLGAIYYLINHLIKQSRAHHCDDCGLMKLKKESEAENKINNN